MDWTGFLQKRNTLKIGVNPTEILKVMCGFPSLSAVKSWRNHFLGAKGFRLDFFRVYFHLFRRPRWRGLQNRVIGGHVERSWILSVLVNPLLGELVPSHVVRPQVVPRLRFKVAFDAVKRLRLRQSLDEPRLRISFCLSVITNQKSRLLVALTLKKAGTLNVLP